MPFGATNSLSVVRFHEISNPYHTRGAWPVDTASTDVNMTCLGSRLASSSSLSLSLSFLSTHTTHTPLFSTNQPPPQNAFSFARRIFTRRAASLHFVNCEESCKHEVVPRSSGKAQERTSCDGTGGSAACVVKESVMYGCLSDIRTAAGGRCFG